MGREREFGNEFRSHGYSPPHTALYSPRRVARRGGTLESQKAREESHTTTGQALPDRRRGGGRRAAGPGQREGVSGRGQGLLLRFQWPERGLQWGAGSGHEGRGQNAVYNGELGVVTRVGEVAVPGQREGVSGRGEGVFTGEGVLRFQWPERGLQWGVGSGHEGRRLQFRSNAKAYTEGAKAYPEGVLRFQWPERGLQWGVGSGHEGRLGGCSSGWEVGTTNKGRQPFDPVPAIG